jgi:hypothetical protein
MKKARLLLLISEMRRNRLNFIYLNNLGLICFYKSCCYKPLQTTINCNKHTIHKLEIGNQLGTGNRDKLRCAALCT